MTEFNRRFSDTDPCWLIKVDAHISGPFSFNEIISRLTTGTLAPHHEAISPMDRWRPLHSQPLFVAAIERLRRRQEEAVEYTMTKTERSNVTKTMDLTPDRMTPTPLQETLTPPPVFQPSPAGQRVYSDAPVGRPDSTERKWPLLPIGLAALVVVGAALFILSPSQAPVAVVEKKSDFVTYFDQGLKLKKIAHWSEALKNFSLAHQLNPRDMDLALEMAPLLIQLEGQTSYARSLVEKALLGQYKKETLALGQNLLGLAHSYESQQQSAAYPKALKHFNEALQNDEEADYMPAMINKGWLLISQGRFKEAESVLLKTLPQNPYSQIGALYLIEGYVLEGFKENNKASYQKAQQLTAQMVNLKLYDGLQEILLFHAFLTMKLGGDRLAVQRFLQNATSLDPDLTSDHVHPPIIDWRGFQWKSFDFICQELSKFTTSEQNQLLQFICKYKGKGVLSAQQSLDSWMARSPKEALPHVASAIASQSVGELDKARESLELAHKLGAQDRLYYQVLFKVCLKLRDQKCLKDILPTLQKVSPLHAYTTQVFLEPQDANSFLRGIKESSNYSFLLGLQK